MSQSTRTSYTQQGKIRQNSEAKEEAESQLVRFQGTIRRGVIAGTLNNGMEPKAKRPRLFGQDRYCQECDTRLGSYNKGPNCYAHSSLRYPRVRGRT